MTVNSEPASRLDRDQPRLDRDQLISATVALVDQCGVDRFTMRMLAEEVGRSTMATYRHVANKEELIALAAEAILSGIEIPEAKSGTPRARLRMLGHSAFQQLASHPWVAPFLLTTGHSSPQAGLILDEIARIVAEVEPDSTRAHYAAGAIRAYLIGWLAGSRAPELPMTSDQESGISLSASAQARFDFGLDALITGILASVS